MSDSFSVASSAGLTYLFNRLDSSSLVNKQVAAGFAGAGYLALALVFQHPT